MSTGTAMTEEEGRLLAELVRDLVGMNYDCDRVFLLSGRLAVQMAEAGCDSYVDYYQRVKYERGEIAEKLIEAVVNNETYFFRELAQLEAVAELAEQSTGKFRVLSAACSSGEEPYSLAMLLDERGLLTPRVEIVGVDVSRKVLAKARDAVYGQHSFRGVEGRYVDAHFMTETGGLRVAEKYRKAVTFIRGNLLQAMTLSSLGTFDVVLCRNVLIYFDAATKRAVVDNLLDRLNPGGLLFLGHSESLFGIRDDARVARLNGCVGYRLVPRAQDASSGRSVGDPEVCVNGAAGRG